MKATSIHLTCCDIGASEAHNKREKELDYIRKDLSELNESFSYIDHSLQTELANIKREVKAKTGRKLQKNAIPIKEGVIVIDENTTMKDLQNFCEECRTRFGMVPLQIHIHRDEGHVNAKEWKPNLHAHITWRMYDDNGRNVRLSRQDVTDMQTMAAHHLHMARGKSSDKKYLSSLQQRIKSEELRLEGIENAIKNAEGKLSKKGAKAVYEATRDVLSGKVKKELDATKEALETANNTIETQAKDIVDLKRGLRSANDTNTRLLKKVNKMNDKFDQQAEDIANIEAIRAERDQVKKDYAEKEENLNTKISYKTKRLEERENALKDKETELTNFYKDAEELGLSCKQANQLKREGSLTLPGIILPDGTTIQRDDPQNPNITLRYGNYAPDDKGDKTRKGIHINLHYYRDWKSVKTWITEALRSAWYKINGIPNNRRSQRMGY